jgi:integrase
MSKRVLPTGITKERIAAADLDATISGKAVLLWDNSPKGFFARVGPPNTKFPLGKTTFGVHKRQGGRGSRAIAVMFGTYPEMDISTARDKAISLIAQIRNGENPSQDKNSLFAKRRQEYHAYKNHKFRLILEDYRKKRIAENTKGDTNYFEKEMPYLFDKYVIPHIGNRTFSEIRKDDLKVLLREIPTLPMRGKVEAMLKPIFKYATTEDIINSNPFDGIAPTPKPKSRDRYLSTIEIQALWSAACDTIDTDKPLFGHFYKLLLLSAARLREIAELEISELQLDRAQIHIAARRMKNDHGHIIPLSPFAIAQINAIPRKHKTYVFSYGRSHLSGFSAAKVLIDEGMQPYLKTQNQEFKPWVNHSLRHTFATHMAEQGANTDIIDRCLSHMSRSQEGVRGVYQLYEFIPERRQAMQLWSDLIESLTA